MTGNNIKNNSLQVSEIFAVFKANWFWFALSLIVFVAATVYFVQKTSPRYKRSMSILIKDETRGGNIGATADVIASLGFFQSRINIQNELLIIQAPLIIRETVEKLSLNERYSIKSGMRFEDLYKKSPISVILKDKNEDDGVRCIFHILSDSEFEITDIRFNGSSPRLDKAVIGQFDKEIDAGFGKLTVSKTLFMDKQYFGEKVYYSNCLLPVQPTILRVN